jgi:hypothetical protein
MRGSAHILAKDVVYFSQGDGREAFEGCDEDVH